MSTEDQQKVELQPIRSSKSIRDEFAMAALPGIIRAFRDVTDPQVAKWAYQVADLMMEERKASDGYHAQ